MLDTATPAGQTGECKGSRDSRTGIGFGGGGGRVGPRQVVEVVEVDLPLDLCFALVVLDLMVVMVLGLAM